ncbi:DEAD/DEAH box helicase [Natronincola ferrireducens]|uniref:Superfamily II DNA or RNA helicase, SNF2 family n=1 Tax=Natronincola ferrireducens TaxID=393762 RepID=A0A1G8ZUP3_9FIRM|nr:DEAD/DEAH box helicase [Natronincola ferrireducens]SDK18849.1 Superfamily II DNA or RNA helicase, SNF2 family [Natronincola ferrireducens]
MFQIDQNLLIDIVEEPKTLHRGVEYFTNDRVKSLRFYKDTMTFVANVKGAYLYEVEVDFDFQGKFMDANCTCPAYGEYWGYCKHIVAVLLKIKEKDRLGNFQVKHREENQAKVILEYFRIQQDKHRVPLQMEVTYEVEGASYITLRIGEDRLYVVRSMKEFIEKIHRNEKISFGKNFIFDPLIHRFRKRDEKIIELIEELYEHEKTLERNFYYKKRESLFKGKRVELTDKALKRFLGLLQSQAPTSEEGIKVKIFNNEYNNIKIYEGQIPLSFHLDQQEENMFFKMEYEGPLIPLVKDGEYFFTKDGICRIGEEIRRDLLPFYQMLGDNPSSKIPIDKEEQEAFLSEVYPVIKGLGRVETNKKLDERINTAPLKIEVYFDRSDNKITADVRFLYGTTTIYPFNPNEGEKEKSNRVVLRDIQGERRALSFFENRDFKVKNNKIYLDNEDSIYALVYEDLEELQKLGEVYYSEDFKAIEIKRVSSFQGAFRLNLEENLLEFHFDIEDVEEDELREVFKSLRQKKKYYRLKNGSFIPLEEKALMDIGELMDRLDIVEKDFHNKAIKIPKSKALYIDDIINEKGLDFVKRHKDFKRFVENVKEYQEVQYPLPETLKGILRNYQLQGFQWLKSLSQYGLGGILADDMGLGKTLQVLTYLVSEGEEKGGAPSLVIAPTSLVYNWVAEIEKFTPQLKAIAIVGSKSERVEKIEALHGYDVVVTSYPLMRRDGELYEQYSFRCCILDEAQHIKNPFSQNAKAVKDIKAEYYFALTGTPIENSLTELWSIFDFVMPGYLSSHHRFKNRFEKPIVGENDKAALRDLGRMIRPFILRRMKKDVLLDLPEKIESKIIGDLTTEQKKLYVAYLKKIKGELQEEIKENGFEKSQIKILAALTRLRQICCHPALFMEDYRGGSGKLEILQEIIEDTLKGGHRMLLFSQFTSMLKIIRPVLEELGIDYHYLDGATPMEERGYLVKSFNEGKGKIFLISLKAGGTGLNLTGADTVIHFDPWWNPAIEDQASDRAYRMGQKNKVHVMKLITKGTIEEKIFKLQEKKKEMINAVIQPGETLLNKMSQKELMELFEISV